MARAKSEWQFIDVKLETEDKPKLEKFAKEYKLDVEAILTEISAMGYKLSISYVDKQNSFVVSVSGNDRTKHNNGCTMTSWSDDVIEALFMAAYKVIVVTDRGIWSEYATDTSNWG